MNTSASPVRRALSALGYGGRMLASRLRGHPLLVIASLYPTHRCNLRCVYCNSPFLNTAELSTAQWFEVIDQLAALGCRRVLILGGEPLLRPDVPDMIDRVRGRGMTSVLTSNGLLVPRQIERLRGLSTLVLSLDGPRGANDSVRGAGVFDAVVEAVASARRVGVPVKINAVMSAETAPLLADLLEFVDRHDLYVSINIMRSGAADLWRDAQKIKAEDRDIAELLARLGALARRNRRVLFSPATYAYAATWGDYGRDRFELGELSADDPRMRDAPACQAGRYYMSINPDGTVFPCVTTMGRIRGGNVARDGVEAAWRLLHDHRCAVCYSPCLVEKNQLFSLKPAVVRHFIGRHLRRFA